VLDADGSPGSQPTDLLLIALAGCAAMDVISIVLKKRQVLSRYHVTATGEQRDAHPHTFTRIDVEHEVEGERLDGEAIRRAIELSATRYCPVAAHMAKGDTEIVQRYLVRDADGERQGEAVVTGPAGRGLDPLPD
jgi:putative redox protein